MKQPDHVLVVIPARDEAGGIAACVRSVAGSLDAFLRDVTEAAARGLAGEGTGEGTDPGQPGGAVPAVGICVVAHRCTDDTAQVARAALEGWAGPQRLARVVADEQSTTVGQVRALGVESFLEQHSWPRDGSTWIFSVDADETPAPDWVTGTLAEMSAASEDIPGAEGAEPLATAGQADAEGRAPSLVVRLDAYDSAGGFAALPGGDRVARGLMSSAAVLPGEIVGGQAG